MAITGICAFTSSPRLIKRRSMYPSNGARISVSRSCRSDSFVCASDAVMLALKFLAFCSATS